MLILASVAADKGWQVLLGGKIVMYPMLYKLPEGVILTKSVVPGEYEILKRFRNEGHLVVSVDAEGLVLSKGEIGTTLRYSEETIDLASALFFWGRRQMDRVVEIFPSIKAKSHVTGTPVFDIWRYQKFRYLKNHNPDNKPARMKILVATSFAYPNHVISEDMAKRLLVNTIKQSTNKDNYLNEFFKEGSLQREVFPYFLSFIENLFTRYPEHEFILRPHIAENPDPWINIGKNFDNVAMSLEGEISPILLDSDILIHFNSTTSLEATYFGKTVITYVPKGNIPEDLFLMLNEDATAASHMCFTEEEAFEIIDKNTKGMQLKTDINLNDIIHEFDSTEIANSSLQIASVIENLDIVSNRPFPKYLYSASSMQSILDILKRRLLWALGWIDHWTGLFNKKHALSRNIFKYGKTKQGEVDIKDFYNYADELLEELGLSNSGIKIEKLKNALFKISKS